MNLSWRIARRSISAKIQEKAGFDTWARLFETHAFPAKSEPIPDLALEITPRKGWRNPEAFEGVRFELLEGNISRRVFMDRPDLSGVLEQRGERYEGEFEVSADSPAPLTVLVRSCLSFLCEDRGELLVHASGVERNGRLWVFCGPPTSGKTTIAVDLRAQGTTFGVDRVVLTVKPGGGVHAHSTPFSDTDDAVSCPLSGPVAGIAFIEKASGNDLSRLTPQEVVPMLLKETTAFSRDRYRLEKIMGSVGAIAESGLCHCLRFRKDESFWSLLDNVAPGPV